MIPPAIESTSGTKRWIFIVLGVRLFAGSHWIGFWLSGMVNGGYGPGTPQAMETGAVEWHLR